MSVQTIRLKGEEYVILLRREYDKMMATNGKGNTPLPPLPAADKDGNTPAVALARASIAREIIERMNAAGLNQAELARRAHHPHENAQSHLEMPAHARRKNRRKNREGEFEGGSMT